MKKKYHYVYKIIDSDGYYYIGLRSSYLPPEEDSYMGSGKSLKLAQKLKGINNFKKEILKQFSTRQEASDYEAELVTIDLVNDPLCYNLILGGELYNPSLGKIWITKFDKSSNNHINLLIFPNKLDEYLNNGWKKGLKLKLDRSGIKNSAYGKHWVRKIIDGELKAELISPKDLNRYLEDGWEIGGINTMNDSIRKSINKDRVWINKDKNYKMVLKAEVNNYLNDGWKMGGKQFDNKKAWVSKLRDDNTVEVKRIDEKDIQFYLENNWVKGRKGILKLPKIRKSVKGENNPAFGKVHVHKLENNKIIRTLINKDELENYLNNGWITGIKNKSNQK